MCPRAHENAVFRTRMANPNHLQLAALDRLANAGKLDSSLVPDFHEQMLEVRKPIRLDPRDIQSGTCHFQWKADSILRKALGRRWIPDSTVGRGDHSLHLPRH
jgi:hypothetical protein